MTVIGRTVVISFTLLLLFFQVSCDNIQVTQLYQNGAVASASPIASEIGSDIFRQGGNAFDVAVAVGFALAVVHPQAGNLGGGGFAVIRDGETGDILSLDFREKAPALASEKMFLDSTDNVIEDLSTESVLAAGVPGTVAGLYELWHGHGSLPWHDLVTPALKLADTGFIVSPYLAGQFAIYKNALSLNSGAQELYAADGSWPKEGERLILKPLAETLNQILVGERAAFYEGEIAQRIVAFMEEVNGLITKDDLLNYNPVWREPIKFSFDSLDIYSMPPPSSGGLIVGQILSLLEPFDLSQSSANSVEFIHLFCESSRLAFADRAVHLGDPDFWEIPSHLLDKEYLDLRRSKISKTSAGSSTEPTDSIPHESDQTTHYSVCDSKGNMVAVTVTLNAPFGSMLVVSEAGFLLNNEMDDFSIRPGYANLYGLVGGDANKIEPGKRMLSSMSPSLVLKNEKPLMILGSRGGSKIITTVAQAIVNYSRFKLSAEEIVAQPRVHHQWQPDIIYVEENGMDIKTKEKLISMGHEVKDRSTYGGLEMIIIDQSGLMKPVSDPRNEGATAGY